MIPPMIALVVATALFVAVWLGLYVRRHLPEPHLSADTKDAVKIAMGLVATLPVAVVFWLSVIFFSFSLFAPDNSTASFSLMISALSVAVAIFLMLELNQPFHGLIHISPALLEKALPHS